MDSELFFLKNLGENLLLTNKDLSNLNDDLNICLNITFFLNNFSCLCKTFIFSKKIESKTSLLKMLCIRYIIFNKKKNSFFKLNLLSLLFKTTHLCIG